jgi:cytosine/adenosine deaminase-related metal-dependent hydrolase
MSRRLIRGGIIVPVDTDVGQFESGDILIEDGEIEAVAPDLDPGDADVIDASDSIVVPGFVDAHVHLWQTVARGIAGDWSLADYFANMLAKVGPHIEPDDLYLSTLFGSFEKLDAGCTAVLDWAHATNSPEHADRAVDALVDAGIRGRFCHGPPGDDVETWWYADDAKHPEDIVRLTKNYFPAGDGRVRPGMAIRGPDSSSLEIARHDIQMARDLGIPVSMHIGVRDSGGVEALADADLLGPDLNFTHANQLSPAEFDLLADAGASVTVTPEVELQMGHGLPVVREVVNGGSVPSLGIDIASNVAGEMFTQIRFALQTARGLANEQVMDAGNEVEDLPLTAREALEFATIEGAKTLGMADEIGSITPGKRADLVLISTDRLNTLPVRNPVETVVFQANPANVDTVLVDGAVVKRNGTLTSSLADDHRGAFVETSHRLLNQAGLGSG